LSLERTCVLLSHCFARTKQIIGGTQKNKKAKSEKRVIQINYVTTFEKKNMYATFIKGEGNKGPTMYGAEESFLLFFSSCFFLEK